MDRRRIILSAYQKEKTSKISTNSSIESHTANLYFSASGCFFNSGSHMYMVRIKVQSYCDSHIICSLLSIIQILEYSSADSVPPCRCNMKPCCQLQWSLPSHNHIGVTKNCLRQCHLVRQWPKPAAMGRNFSLEPEQLWMK